MTANLTEFWALFYYWVDYEFVDADTLFLLLVKIDLASIGYCLDFVLSSFNDLLLIALEFPF